MDVKTFQEKQYPLCLGLPFYGDLVRRGLYYTLSERSETDFQGRNYFEPKCPRTLICDDRCWGRPIPAYEELDKYKDLYGFTATTINGKPFWLMKVELCGTCPVKSSCTTVCSSVSAFTKRKSSLEDFRLDYAVPLEQLSDEWLETLYMDDADEGFTPYNVSFEDLAWDCLSEPQKAAIILVQVQGKSISSVAMSRNVNPSSIQKSLKSGMDKLKEFGLARKVLLQDNSCIYALDYYKHNLSMSDIALKHCRSLSTIFKHLQAFRVKNKLSI